MPTVIVSDKQLPYVQAVQKFLDWMDGLDVKYLACVAYVGSDEVHSVTSYWKAGPYDLMNCADILDTDAIYASLKRRLKDDGVDFPEEDEENSDED
jgi:hypothetical protein